MPRVLSTRTLLRLAFSAAAVTLLVVYGGYFTAAPHAQTELVVRTVPWLGLPHKPHEVFPGGVLILQGMATQGLTDVGATGITSATWDPGDGGAIVNVTAAANANPLAIETTHTYNGVDGQPFTATLTVTNNLGQTASDTFRVVVKTKTIDVEANMGIDKGLWYLHKQLNRGIIGTQPAAFVSYGAANGTVAATAGTVQAFQINNHLTTADVSEDPYVHDTIRLLHWLENQLAVQALNPQNGNNPDTDGNNKGLYPNTGNPLSTAGTINYIVGQVIDAFVSSGTPDAVAVLGPAGDVQGRTYAELVQDMMDFNNWAAIDTGGNRGSWYYAANNNAGGGHADNSIAQWPAIGGIAGERVWGLTTPSWVKTDALNFLPNTYNTAANGFYNGVSRAGSFGYSNVNAGWNDNVATTPSALVQYIWAGVANDPTPDDANEQRFRDGLGFMARYHRMRNNYACCDQFGGINFYALYATAKAYRLATNELGEVAPITMVDDDPSDGVPAWNWYANDPPAGAPASAGPRGVARAVLMNQQASGAFPGGSQWTGNLTTAWGVIILSPTLFQLGPTAVCTVNPAQIGSFGGVVQFNGAGSFHNDNDGEIVSYAWDFDDGSTATTTNASHTYAASGTPKTFNATLTVTDANGLTDTATCAVEQVNTNVAPDANAGGPYNFCPNTPLIVDGSASIDEEDGTTLSYEWDFTEPLTFSPVEGMTPMVDASAFFAGRPLGSYNIGLRVKDSLGVANSEFTTVVVRSALDPLCNQPPVATDNAYTTNEDTSLSGNVITDAPPDSDPNASDVLSASIATSTASGTLTAFATDGSFTYTPNANFCGSDSFTYRLHDGTVFGNTATVAITVVCVNDAPAAEDDSNATTEETPVSGSVTANDTTVDVEGDTLTWSLTGGASNGNVVFAPDGTYTYSPNLNFCGSDSFTYQVSDGTAADSAVVTVTVSCVNDPPVAADNSHVTPEDTPVSGTATSTDVDGGAPVYALAGGPSNGTLVFNPDGTYTYSPNANYNGPDSFAFTVSDGAGGSDTGQVTIIVTPVNDAPVCSAAAPTIANLWSPNHALVNIDVLGVTDPVEGSAVGITIDSIWQDEPTNTQGDGNTPIDGYGVGLSTAQVRVERDGRSDGRMYHIFFTGTDAEGGTCTGEVRVGVPHDQGNGSTVVDGGPLYKSTGS